AEDAVAAPLTLGAVVVRDDPPPTESLGAAAQRRVRLVDLVVADRLRAEVALDALEVRRAGEREAVLAPPGLGDPGRRADAQPCVVEGRAADPPALHDQQRMIARPAHAALGVEARDRRLLALVDVLRRERRAGLDREDAEP